MFHQSFRGLTQGHPLVFKRLERIKEGKIYQVRCHIAYKQRWHSGRLLCLLKINSVNKD